jgi:hypothetical protein
LRSGWPVGCSWSSSWESSWSSLSFQRSSTERCSWGVFPVFGLKDSAVILTLSSFMFAKRSWCSRTPLRRRAQARQAVDLDLSFGSVVSTQTSDSDPFSCALSP